MNRVLRWMLRVLLTLVGVAATAGVIAWVLIAGSLPDYDGRVTVSGISAPVEIVRDANAVPHIRATTDADAWFAMGLVHAQDRLWQMEVARRSAQGRLSAILGPRTVALDRLARTLDIYGYARRAVEHQSPDATLALESYAAGVNAWIRHVNANALGRGAPEFFVYGDGGIAPWTPADSVAIIKMMALRLSRGATEEVRRAAFQLALPPERVPDILPDYPAPARTTVERYGDLFPGARFAMRALPEPDPLVAALGPAPVPELAGASNAWAVDASRSSSKRPLLANDPHLWLSAPGVWYLVDVKGERLSAVGGSLPGTPLVLIGHNGEVGWGLTTANVDDQDLYIERINPENPDEYLTPVGWQPFDSRRIRIEVAGAEPIVETVRATRHGPVLSAEQFRSGTVTPDGHVASLAWTALRDDDRGVSAVISLMRARTRREAMAAAALVTAPAQVVTLADREGIAMILAGAVPERRSANPGRGRIPSPGWTSAGDWQGLRPAETNPTVMDPSEGAIANANNRLTDRPFPEHIGHDWAPPYRIQRIEKELSGRRFHSRDSFLALQVDTVSEMARAVLPLIARDLWWREDARTADGLRGEALAMLADWNGEMDQHSPEPLIFYEWMRWLTRRLAEDELGSLIGQVAGPQPLFVERVFRDIDGAAVWCDVDKTPERETCSDMASRALDDALSRLSREYGANLAGWRWGAAHLAVHRHTPFGYVAGIDMLFNVTQETSGGNHTILRGAMEGEGERPFRNVHASGMRMVLDFADLDRAIMMIAPGQSGHPFSRWYDHLAEPWARGDGISVSQDDEDARSGAVGVMTLVPRLGPDAR